MLSLLSRGRPLPRPAAPSRALAAPPPPPPPPSSSGGGGDGDDAQQAETAVRSGWDPEGLFGSASPAAPAANVGSGDLFARQQARRAAAQQQRQQEQEQAAAAAAAASAAAAAAAARPPLLPPPPPPLDFDEPVVPMPDEWAAYDDAVAANSSDRPSPPPGPLVARLPPAARAELAASVAAVFPGFDLDHPGLRVLHLRPPVLAVDGFASPEDCDAWMREAEASGRLATSRVGAGHAGSDGSASASSSSASPASVSYDAAQRTSSNLLVDAATRKVAPVLGLLADAFQERALALADAVPPALPPAAAAASEAGGATGAPQAPHHRPGASWGVPGRMPLPRQYTFEAPQVTRYLPPAAAAAARGQLFGAHEDAFPRVVARANGFQRHATLLLYLNGRDARDGGATRFAHLRAPASPQGGGAAPLDNSSSSSGGGSSSSSGGSSTLAVTPERGQLLVFFPSLDDGTPDARTLHAADEVVSGEPKWVMQQWVARGYASPSALRQMQMQQRGQQAPSSTAPRGGGGGVGSGGGSAEGARSLTRKERREQARKEAALSKQKQQGARRRAAD